ncbi:hypothetical protein HK102_012156, partial [Quaeritorhiza haematococci]
DTTTEAKPPIPEINAVCEGRDKIPGPLYKYGSTHRLESRFLTHKCHHHKINNDFYLVFAIETPWYQLVERALAVYVRSQGRDRTMDINGAKQVEFMELDESFSLDHIKEKVMHWVASKSDCIADCQVVQGDSEVAQSLLAALGFKTFIRRDLLKKRFLEWARTDGHATSKKLMKGYINKILKPLGVRITIASQHRDFVDGKQIRNGIYRLETFRIRGKTGVEQDEHTDSQDSQDSGLDVDELLLDSGSESELKSDLEDGED